MDTVRKTMNRPTEADLHDLHERRRERNRAKVREAILALRPRIGPEARRRLADRHVAIIICADIKEVRRWIERLSRFQSRASDDETVAAVKWHRVDLPQSKGEPQQTIDVPLIFWDGGASVAEQAVYYHELSHLVDKSARDDRLSDSREWMYAWSREKEQLKALIAERSLASHVGQPKESFAMALAEAWRSPKNAAYRIPLMYRFLEKQGLVVDL